MAEHPTNIGKKPHIQHPVGFVEHQILELVELGVGHPEVVEQTARSRHQNIDAAAEGVLLRPHANAAIDGGCGQRGVQRNFLNVCEHLRGQFTRRDQHERACRASRTRHQAVKNRERKSGSLAASGHGAGEYVAAKHRRGDCVLLNWRRLHIADFLDSTQQIGV